MTMSDPILNFLNEEALRVWGPRAVLDKVQEECQELALEITRERMGRKHGILEECADVELMCTQARRIFGDDEIDRIKREKMHRTLQKLKDWEAEHGTWDNPKNPLTRAVERPSYHNGTNIEISDWPNGTK